MATSVCMGWLQRVWGATTEQKSVVLRASKLRRKFCTKEMNIWSYIISNLVRCTQSFHKLSHCYVFRHCRVILRQPVINTCTVHLLSFSTMNQQMHKIISQIITLLRVSTLSCHPQTACNQYMYIASFIILYNEPTNAHNYSTNYHTTTCFDTVVSSSDSLQSIPLQCIFYHFVQWTKKCTQLFHKLSHCYMFQHYPVILRQPVTNTLPSYTGTYRPALE